MCMCVFVYMCAYVYIYTYIDVCIDLLVFAGLLEGSWDAGPVVNRTLYLDIQGTFQQLAALLVSTIYL